MRVNQTNYKPRVMASIWGRCVVSALTFPAWAQNEGEQPVISIFQFIYSIIIAEMEFAALQIKNLRILRFFIERELLNGELFLRGGLAGGVTTIRRPGRRSPFQFGKLARTSWARNLI
jgi:hypothetical protein